jgi:hypothetical protein
MSGEDKKQERPAEQSAGDKAWGAIKRFGQKRLDDVVPPSVQKGAVELLGDAGNKPDAAAQGASAAGKTDNPLDRAFAEGRRLGEKAATELRDGVKKLVPSAAPASGAAAPAAAASAPADGKKEPTLGERAEQALKDVTGGVGKAAEGVKSDVVNTLEEAQKAGGKLVDGVAAALKPVEPAAPSASTSVPAAVAPVNSAPKTALLASDAQAKASESAPDLVASASASKKSEFNPRFNKPDGKGEVVITKKDGGGVSIQTSTESVYERALKAMKANDTAAGKEPQKYEALSAAAEVAAQATPKANPTGSKGHAK